MAVACLAVLPRFLAALPCLLALLLRCLLACCAASCVALLLLACAIAAAIALPCRYCCCLFASRHMLHPAAWPCAGHQATGMERQQPAMLTAGKPCAPRRFLIRRNSQPPPQFKHRACILPCTLSVWLNAPKRQLGRRAGALASGADAVNALCPHLLVQHNTPQVFVEMLQQSRTPVPSIRPCPSCNLSARKVLIEIFEPWIIYHIFNGVPLILTLIIFLLSLL
jgi:hypothetical protein